LKRLRREVNTFCVGKELFFVQFIDFQINLYYKEHFLEELKSLWNTAAEALIFGFSFFSRQQIWLFCPIYLVHC
jgi:hypothetical protein